MASFVTYVGARNGVFRLQSGRLEPLGLDDHRVWIGYAQIYDNNNNPTGVWGNVADQHTADRYHVAWNANWNPSTQPDW